MPLISKAFSDLITFSRTGSTATYFAANGVLTAAAADVPRFDYDPATFLPRGLLIEEARTNLLTYSADFSDASWTKTDVTITADNTTDPAGTTTADLLTEGTAGTAFTTRAASSTVAAGATVSSSVFVKRSAVIQWLRVRVSNSAASNGGNVWFDIQNGVLGNQTNVGSGTNTVGTITAINNGWYRITATTTLTAGDTTASTGFCSASANGSTTRVNSSAYWLWGAQLEAGAFPTSYIPTTTTALTRDADTANINTMSPWYNQVNGSVYAEFVIITDGSATQTNAVQGVWSTTQSALGSFNGYGTIVNLTTNTTSKLAGRARYAPTGKNNVISIGSATGYIDANTIYKTAVAWDASNIVADSNIGALNSTANTAAVDMGTHDRMTLGSQNVGGSPPYQLNGWLRKITFYPTKLSDANLGTLTT